MFDEQVILFEPLKKINCNFYRCDTKFHIDRILNMFEIEKSIGVILLSGKEVRLYTLTQNKSYHDIKLNYKFEIELQKKHGRGGQSSVRFERIRVEKYMQYQSKIIDMIFNTYLLDNYSKYLTENFIFAGPCSLKREIYNDIKILKYFGEKTLNIIDTTEITDQTIHDIYKSNICIVKQDSQEIKTHVDELNTLIRLASDQLVFSHNDIILSLKECQLKKIIVSRNLQTSILDEIKLLNMYECEIIQTYDLLIEKYGGCVGIKWFACKTS